MSKHEVTSSDVADGIVGAAGMLLALATPMLRGVRSHWGLPADLADWDWPGDEAVAEPGWQWTHGVEINAPVEQVWPWVAQLGQGRAGFYSYQWLENLAGCDIENAEDVHEEWQDLHEGDGLRLHPDTPPLEVIAMEPGRWFLCFASSDLDRDEPLPPGPVDPDAAPRRWMQLSWLFHVEPLDGGHSRLVSRFRCACSKDLSTRTTFGPGLVEPVGFVMDRRMLLGVKERAERATRLAAEPG